MLVKFYYFNMTWYDIKFWSDNCKINLYLKWISINLFIFFFVYNAKKKNKTTTKEKKQKKKKEEELIAQKEGFSRTTPQQREKIC